MARTAVYNEVLDVGRGRALCSELRELSTRRLRRSPKHILAYGFMGAGKAGKYYDH